MFIDEIDINISAGRGGNGVVRWRHEKSKEFSGAAGGNGGRGGDVYARAIRDIHGLARYRNKKEFQAERGGDGEGGSRHGKNGDDLILEFPVGSLVTNTKTGTVWSLEKDGEELKLLSGGGGGLGNEHFKGSRNTTPQQSTPGKIGEEADFHIEVLLVADAGFIGLPNAGKSSLLNGLTNAHAKVGAFPFTTLDPNLGELFGYVLADIPGIIEGASGGKGLGYKFLRHVERTRLLVHAVSLEHEDVVAAWKTVREELSAYSTSLKEKPEMILLTKTDLVSAETVAAAKKALSAASGAEVLDVSWLDDESLKRFEGRLMDALRSLGASGAK